MFVINPKSGRAIAQSFSISCRWLAPISTTAKSVSGVIDSSVSGTPMWLFRLPWVTVVSYFCDSVRPTNSLVVVLPLLPVIARIITPSSLLW